MPDGLYLDLTATDSLRPGVIVPSELLALAPPEPASPLDLSTFDLWIELQPVELSVELLYRLAEDLSKNKGWPGVGFEVRKAADDLRTLTRHQGGGK